MKKSFAKRGLTIALALVLGAGMLPGAAAGGVAGGWQEQSAYADDAEELEQATEAAEGELTETEQKVQETATEYNEAVARQEELAEEIAKLDKKIAKLEKKLPEQRERGEESCRALYKYQYDTSSVVMMILDSESITDMLAMIDEYNWVLQYNIDEIAKTVNMENELEESKSALESDKTEADQVAEAALVSLDEAKAARQAAQEEAAAAQQAEEEAKQKAAEEAAEKAETEEEKQEAEEEAEESSTASEQSSADNVDWSSDKTAFVEKWASRIDSYLAGSPTAGTGEYYAEAAWDYGVDPRWAPAISTIESGKGNNCFASYNAWGFGSSGYGSWEDGINAVVSALGSSTYGGYHTRAAASTYCPGNADAWYSNVAAEMAKI